MTTDSSKVGKKKRILCVASLEGIERAEKALMRLGFGSKTNFAKSQRLGGNTVTNFFTRQPIQVDSFKKICQELKLDWEKTIDMGEEKQLEPSLEIKHCPSSDQTKEVNSVETHYRQVTIIDKENQQTKAVIELEGDIDTVNKDLSLVLELALQNIAGNTMKITSIKPGSIKLFVEGSPEDIERLMSQFNSGELTELRGFPITNIKILTEDPEDQENREREDKWQLVQEIVSQQVQDRNLINVDLSDADLSKAFLFRANLSEADLSEADLSGADLIGANLSGANLSGANVTYSKFGNNEGISRTVKNDLIRRGAIFGDSPVRL